jgi:OmpA-OmpF porin, OOP family
MNKVVLSVAAAAALSFASFGASAATHDGAFVAVNGGSSHFDVSHTNFDDNNDTAIGGMVGYRWVVDRPFAIGVEGGYVDLGNMSWKDQVKFGNITDSATGKYKAKALLIGANGKWDLPHGFTITAHAGVAHSKIEYSVNEYVNPPIAGYTPFHGKVDSHDNAIYGGLGFGYDFNPNFGITVNYDNYALKAEDVNGDKRTVNIGVFGVQAEYRF